ncbi:response regulator [Pseudomonas sp. LS1212]|uniref:response regulator n=1 Tax=Pseudomonas sp. LS1212 TaxID=2972478 RepID=UPI00215C9711|nr:response regulator [Pseudomonas sp. LS1212]UVJ46588.1 response regulator [Pseudomonas sp. LS1212]
MPNKKMRILIADEHHVQLMQIEKMLNQMGYYRIAPVQSFVELLSIVQSALEPFHLLIANTDLATHAGVDLTRFCGESPQIQHALLYETQYVMVPAVPANQRKSVSVCLPRLPDADALQTFMQIIDSPVVIGQLESPASSTRAHAKRRINRIETVFSRH